MKEEFGDLPCVQLLYTGLWAGLDEKLDGIWITNGCEVGVFVDMEDLDKLKSLIDWCESYAELHGKDDR